MTLTFGDYENSDEFLKRVSEKFSVTKFNGFSFVLMEHESVLIDLIENTDDVTLLDLDFYDTLVSKYDGSKEFPPREIVSKTEDTELTEIIQLSLTINNYFIQLFDDHCHTDEEIITTYSNFVTSLDGSDSTEELADTINTNLEDALEEYESDSQFNNLADAFDVSERPEKLFQLRIINQQVLSSMLQSIDYLDGNEPSVGDYLVFELKQPTKEEFEHIREHVQDKGANKFRVDNEPEEIPSDMEFATDNDTKYYRIICKVTDSSENESRDYTEYSYYILAHNTDVKKYYPKHPLFEKDTKIEPVVQGQYQIHKERPSGEDVDLVSNSSIFRPDLSVFTDKRRTN